MLRSDSSPRPTVQLSHGVSVASRVKWRSVLLAGATAALGWDPWLYVYAVGGTALVWLLHLDNIQRLLAGTERKIGTPAEGGSTTDGPTGGPGTDGPSPAGRPA